MRRLAHIVALAASTAAAFAVLSPAAPAASGPGTAYSVELKATIDPATQQWISSALDDAASQHANLVIIRLDTPGGLEDSMRSIIQDIEAAPMPVVVYTY